MHYVYYAQSREHPGDPMYAKVATELEALLYRIEGFEPHYIVFQFSPSGGCKAINVQDT